MIAFFKYHGCGNDFIIVEVEESRQRQFSKMAPLLCDRHFGIGSDGLLLIGQVKTVQGSDARVSVTLVNPDGSPMGMCGNGLRCLYRWLCDQNQLAFGAEVVFKTAEGREVPAFVEQGQPALLLASAEFSPDRVPVASPTEVVNQPLVVNGRQFHVTCLSVGNPHCVTFEAGIDVREWGPRFEQHEFFPEKTNVEFVTIESRSRMRVAVWERGAGATLACGTGASAAMAAAYRLGLVDSSCDVILAGGTLRVSLNSNGLVLSGPAEPVFSGVWLSELETNRDSKKG